MEAINEHKIHFFDVQLKSNNPNVFNQTPCSFTLTEKLSALIFSLTYSLKLGKRYL